MIQQNVQYSREQNTPINFGIMFVPQQEAWVIERMGKFNKILSPVIIYIWKFFFFFFIKHNLISKGPKFFNTIHRQSKIFTKFKRNSN